MWTAAVAMRIRILAVPMFYKVLIANSIIVVTGAVVGSSLTLAAARSISPAQHVELILLFAAIGTFVSLAVNFAVLKAAFSPLVQLERTIDEVRTGNLTARASRNPNADPHMDKFTDTLNDMLDSMEHYRSRLQALSAEVLLAQEDERKRVARELHDSTGQLLTGLLLRLKSLENHRDEQVRRTAVDLLDIASRTLEDVRRTAVELRPPALDDLGLVAALQSYISGYAANTGLKARLSAEQVSGRLPPNVELVLYRVVQEALTNTAKHAGACTVDVGLRLRGPMVEATVEDNGAGFDVARTLRSRDSGLGLFGMRERVSLLGGRLNIDSTNGTRIQALVPLQPAFAPKEAA
jgi:two-component system, NarL family, sensor histidine kinase UhpB